MDLHDRVALITGASGGLGAATAPMLADYGAHVAVTHLGHREEAVDLCRKIEATGRKKRHDQDRVVNISGTPGMVPAGSIALAVPKARLIHLRRCPDVIKTERLVLQPWSFEDVPDVLSYAADEEWGRY